MKKAEMSMSIIVGAAIALLILVLLALFVYNAFVGVEEGTQCDALSGGVCIDDFDSCEDGGMADHKSGNCPSGQKCCIAVGG